MMKTLAPLGLAAVAVSMLIPQQPPVDPYADPKTHAPLTAEQQWDRTMKAVEAMIAEQVATLSKDSNCAKPLEAPSPLEVHFTHALVRNTHYTKAKKRQYNTGVVYKMEFRKAYDKAQAGDLWVEMWCWK